HKNSRNDRARPLLADDVNVSDRAHVVAPSKLAQQRARGAKLLDDHRAQTQMPHGIRNGAATSWDNKIVLTYEAHVTGINLGVDRSSELKNIHCRWILAESLINIATYRGFQN
ncbi:hypothetical protein EVAR_49007_1, partial [Eumeta japonica]